MAVYFGINGAVRAASGWKTSVNNVVRTVGRGYCGVSGVVRQFYGAASGAAAESAAYCGDAGLGSGAVVPQGASAPVQFT